MESIDIVILVMLIAVILLLASLFLVMFLRKPTGHVREDLNANKFEIINSLNSSLNMLGNLLTTSNDQFSKQQTEKFDLLVKSISVNLQQISDNDIKTKLETEQKLENVRQSVEKSLSSFSQLTETKLENIRSTMEKAILKMSEDNAKKLDEMRQTVDEKLQKTLEDRISKSFQMVGERLEQVYKGLGEMQSLANGVGDLKKVLTNVKTRGTWGEIQLGNILEEILTSDQYETNIATKKGSADRVEFAVKLPGDGEAVYLPIDAKFPIEDYRALLDAYDAADGEMVKNAKIALARRIKACAKDIHDKYIDVPNTTEFGIMFLPIEGLYAEVVKTDLVETLQRDYKINVAGPTTMAALLNSLQMGFKTLAIQKRSSEVWKLLGAVKTEFETFGKVLDEAQKRITQANDELEKLVGTRTRMIQSKLKNVTALPDVETKIMLPNEE